MSKISLICPVKNEEKAMPDFLRRMNWVDDIVIIDDCSTDRTAEICRKAGARVFSRKLDNFANQRHFGISKAKHDWLLFVDSDEVLSEELKQSIKNAVKKREKDAFFLSIINYLAGKPMLETKAIRLFRRGTAEFVLKEGQEYAIPKKEAGILSGNILHYSYENWAELSFKIHNYYSRLEQEDYLKKPLHVAFWKLFTKPFSPFYHKAWEIAVEKKIKYPYGLVWCFVLSYCEALKFSRIIKKKVFG